MKSFEILIKIYINLCDELRFFFNFSLNYSFECFKIILLHYSNAIQ